MKKCLTAIVCITLFSSASLFGGPLRKQQVSANAKWVAHLSVEDLVKSGMGKYILEKANGEQSIEARMNAFAKLFGLNPLTDLESITLYAENFEPSGGVAIIQAKMDQEKLLQLLLLNKGYVKSKYGDRPVHRWIQKRKGKKDNGVRFGTFYSDKVVVIARTEQVLKHAIDVLDGKAANFSKAKTDFLPKAPKGTFLIAAATDLPTKIHKRRAAMLKNISAGWLVAGQGDKTVFLKASVTANTEDNAALIQQVANGFLALAQLKLNQQQTAQGKTGKPLSLLKAVKVTVKGVSVQLAASIPMAEVKQYIDLSRKLRKAAKAAKMKQKCPKAK
ncbi:MAG: hypothetical protein ISS78_02310 [Phycisphaerae bacterium]|nr:hypothetical protein [Phycisphaerae bacterium]